MLNKPSVVRNSTVLGISVASLLSDTGHEMATAVLPGFLRSLGAPAQEAAPSPRPRTRAEALRYGSGCSTGRLDLLLLPALVIEQGPPLFSDSVRSHLSVTLDALMYPSILGTSARVESSCRATGEPLRLEVGPMA